MSPSSPKRESAGRPRVLCVDDEPDVLSGLTLHLRRYRIETATSGAAGLDLIRQGEPFAVVISDMRMPGMDGAALLECVREEAPDTVRVLLTGYSDMEQAIAAVNRGGLFRFLTKPCPPKVLLETVKAAVEQHHLVTAEKVLLQQTLHGSIRALTDVLALANPVAFGRASRVKQHAAELAAAIGLPDAWQVEIAAMFSQIGCVTLPPATAEKLYNGAELDEREQEMVDKLPGVARKLLENIPRLEPVLDILAKESKPYEGSYGAVPDGARVLRIASDFDTLQTRGSSTQLALDTMRGAKGAYDPEMLRVFSDVKGSEGQEQEVAELPIARVTSGMVFAADVHMTNGALFAARGYEVTESFVERVRNLERGVILEPVRVIAAAVESCT